MRNYFKNIYLRKKNKSKKKYSCFNIGGVNSKSKIEPRRSSRNRSVKAKSLAQEQAEEEEERLQSKKQKISKKSTEKQTQTRKYIQAIEDTKLEELHKTKFTPDYCDNINVKIRIDDDNINLQQIKQYCWRDILIFKSISTIKMYIQEHVFDLMINDKFNVDDTIKFLKYDSSKYNKYELLYSEIYKKLINSYILHELKISSIDDIQTINQIKKIDYILDKFMNKFIKSEQSNPKSGFKYASMELYLKQQFDIFKNKVIPFYFDYKIFIKIKQLIGYYKNKKDISSSAILRICNLFNNNLQKRDWCLDNSNFSKDDRIFLLTILNNSDCNKFRTIIDEDVFKYIPLLTDDNIEKILQDYKNYQLLLTDQDIKEVLDNKTRKRRRSKRSSSKSSSLTKKFESMSIK